MRVDGSPEMNGTGDITGFNKLSEVAEMEPSWPKIDVFTSGSEEVRPARPFGYLVGFDFDASVFFVRDTEIGLDVFAEHLDDLAGEVRADLDILWRTYALAADRDLTSDAQALKKSLRSKFKGAA